MTNDIICHCRVCKERRRLVIQDYKDRKAKGFIKEFVLVPK
jgi:hypothetical protein